MNQKFSILEKDTSIEIKLTIAATCLMICAYLLYLKSL